MGSPGIFGGVMRFFIRRGGGCGSRAGAPQVEALQDGNFAVFKIFLPALTESGKAFDRMRSCALRFAAALWRRGCEALREQGAACAQRGSALVLLCAAG